MYSVRGAKGFSGTYRAKTSRTLLFSGGYGSTCRQNVSKPVSRCATANAVDLGRRFGCVLMTIRAVTFDFWRTLYRDTRSKERHRARVAALVRLGGVKEPLAKAAMKHVMEEFLRIHVVEQRTLQPGDTIPILDRFLGRPLDPDIHGPLIEAFSEAILEHPPELIEDAVEAVTRTAELLPVGIISDSGISPGNSLEQLLSASGLLEVFGVRTFSDRIGVAKPQSAMYEAASAGLSCSPNELFHIGDLEPTDVAGALNVGARAGLFAGDNTRFAGNTRAHYTFHSWRAFIDDLDAILGN